MSQLVRYSRTCVQYSDCHDRTELLKQKLLSYEYLCHKWPRICSVGRNHNPVIFSFMTYHWICSKTDVTLCDMEQEILTLPEHTSSSPVLSGIRVAWSFVFCVFLCWSLFVPLPFFFWPLCCREPSWTWSYGSWIYNYLCNQCLSPLKLWVLTRWWRGVLDKTLCDKVCQWLTGRWFSPSTSSTNNTDSHDITETLLKVALNTINQTN